MDEVCKILIVDDEILVRQGIKHLLNWGNEGFHICGEASNGREALDMIEKMSPHIVITDIVMPLMDGMELTSILKSSYPEIEIIVLSSFGEFQYVRSTFQSGVADYILKPKLDADQLLTILKRSIKKIPSLKLTYSNKEENMSIQSTLDKLLSGYEIDESMQYIMEAFPYPIFLLFGVDLKASGLQNKASWQQKMKDAFAGNEQSIHTTPLPTDGQYAVHLINVQECDRESIMPILRKIVRDSSQIYPEICWTLSDPFYDIAKLYVEYQNNFLKMTQYRYFLAEDMHLIARAELPRLQQESLSFDMNHFTGLLQKRKFEAANDYLFQYVEQATLQYNQDVFVFKTWLGNIIFNITIIVGKLEIDTKALEHKKYEYLKAINESRHINVALKQLYQFINDLNTTLQLNKQRNSNPNMSLIISYIHEHYMEPLSLSEIANQFHFNPSYLSSYFSAHNNEGFSEYLNRVRVERAAELLAKEIVSIAEISEQVGYSDHSYFTKVFKKIMGISPSQYRKLNFHRE